jgi:hypothetical protein
MLNNEMTLITITKLMDVQRPGYLFTKHPTKIENLFLLYTQLNITMFQVRTKLSLHASFDHFEIYDWKIINDL